MFQAPAFRTEVRSKVDKSSVRNKTRELEKGRRGGMEGEEAGGRKEGKNSK